MNSEEDSDVPISELVKKAKKVEVVDVDSVQKKKKEANKGKTSSKGVDPSAEKQKEKKGKSVKKGKQPKTLVSYESSESEGEILPCLPSDSIEGRKVSRGKILKKTWLLNNGLSNLFEMIKAQGWDILFVKKDQIFKSSYREFYRNLMIKVFSKKKVTFSKVHEVYNEFDGMTLATILGIPENNGICTYVKGFWEDSKYCYPVETTRRFAHNDNINKARTVKTTEIRPFTRLLHLFVIKNIVPRFRKRDVAGFLDLTYMEYLMHEKLANFPRLIIRDMAHVIRTPYHELPYGELLTRIFKGFDVSLDEKDATQPVNTNLFKESFLHKCGLKRENKIWWLGFGENRRRDVEEGDLEEESEEEESDSEEKEEAASKEESTPNATKGESLESVDDFYDAVDSGTANDEDKDVTSGNTQPVIQKKSGQSTKAKRVDPSSAAPDYTLIHIQA
ncbi:hypothetical protein Dimus_005544 [Dionaea muscipula]